MSSAHQASRIRERTRYRPDFIVLFFVIKVKFKNLAANENATNLQVSMNHELHTGVVIHIFFYRLIFFLINILLESNTESE